jgi:hypothetical protein
VRKKGDFFMAKKQKRIIVTIFAVIIVIAAGAAVFLNIRETQEGSKRFQLEIISERDGFHETTQERSDLLYLGEYLRTMDGCEYDESEFGLFITGFHGMRQDFSEEYWWCLTINGEDSFIGADEVPLTGGDIYTFTLLKGW